MIIVFDTNIWLSTIGLHTGRASAVKFYMASLKSQVGLPEVVRLETEHHIRKALNENVSKIKEAHNQLLALFGKLKEIVLPSSDDIEEVIKNMFSSTGIDIVEIPFSIQSAHSSFLKTIYAVPPNSEKNQQFKDGVIWADCMQLLQGDDVILVTEDKGFYKERACEKGLAENLFEETQSAKKAFRILSSLEELLERIRVDVQVEDAYLAKEILGSNDESALKDLTRLGFGLGDNVKIQKALFATENPNDLYLKYTAVFDCIDISGANRLNVKLSIVGEGRFDNTQKSIKDIKFNEEKISYQDQNDAQFEINHYFLYADSIVIGHREQVFTIREPLD